MSTLDSTYEKKILLSQTDEDKKIHEDWLAVWRRLAGGEDVAAMSLGSLLAAVSGTEDGRDVPDEVILALQQLDRNKDGLIQREEFLTISQQQTSDHKLTQLLRSAAWMVIPRSDRDKLVRQRFQTPTCCPPPLFIPIISLIQFSAFIYYVVDMGAPIRAMSPCPTYSPLVYNPARRYEVWRYFTYTLIHSGWLHILGNLLTQLVFGVLLEMVHGSARVALIYWSGALCGVLIGSLATPRFYVAGASGSIYALQYAHLANLIINWSELKLRKCQVSFIALMTIVDFSYSIYDTYYTLYPSHVAHLAHLGGALCGILMGSVVLRNLRKLPWEKIFIICAGVIIGVLVTSAVIYNAAAPHHFPPNDYTSEDELRRRWMWENNPGKYFN